MINLSFFSQDSSEQSVPKNEIISDQKIEFNIDDKIESKKNQTSTTNLSSTVKMEASTGTNHIISGMSVTSGISGISGNVVPVKATAVADQSVPKKECNICCEKYNRSNRCPIACSSCGFEACRQCHTTFILDPTNPLPNCMECHKEFPREFLVEKFTQKFVTQDWKKHREQVIYQKEKALLPTRQRVAELVKRKETLRDQETELNAEIAKLESRRREILIEKNRIDYRIRVGPTADNEGASAGNKREQHASFVRPCPNTEANCRGFLSTQWKCNLCNMWACKDCHEIKGNTQDAEHTCHPDNLASAKLIDAETRGCPKCGARVYKISGCNQMFCTACNDCAFDWVTGRIETVIHNPHYYEFQRQRNGGQAPRVAGDILCGREVDHNTIRVMTELLPEDALSIFMTLWKNTNHLNLFGHGPARVVRTPKQKWDGFIGDCLVNKTGIIFGTERSLNETTQTHMQSLLEHSRIIMFHRLQFEEICRTIIDMRLVMLPRYHIDPLRHNEELGVEYLLGRITDQEFATTLQRGDKNMQKCRDIQNVLTMVINTATDIIFRFIDHVRTTNLRRKNIMEIQSTDFEILFEIRELFKYANGCLERISKNYHSKSVLTVGKELEERHLWEDDSMALYAEIESQRGYNHYRNIPRNAQGHAEMEFVRQLNQMTQR